jgi:hypothetical protein
VVNLISDNETAISGVLWQQRGAWLVLRKVELLRPNHPPLAVDGEVLIDRANVSFIQVP